MGRRSRVQGGDAVKLVWDASEPKRETDAASYETASHETVLEVADGVRVNGAVDSRGSVGDDLVRVGSVPGSDFSGTEDAVSLFFLTY